MAVERPAGYDPAPSDPMSAAPVAEEQIEVAEEMIENPDGSVTFGEEAMVQEEIPFGANLAEVLEDDLSLIHI